MIRGSLGLGRYVASETDYVAGTIATDLHTQPRGIVFVHGAGSDTTDATTRMRLLIDRIGRRATVHIGDLGGDQWGSDLHVTRIGQAIDYLGTLGVQEPVALIGQSMGACGALNFAYRHPERVACVAAAIPLVDLRTLRADPALSVFWASVDAIYGAHPSPTIPAHNPVDFAAAMDPDLPIRIWYASDDPIVAPSTVAAFAAARPQTELTDCGPVGHSDVPINAHIVEMNQWIAEHLA